MKAVLVAISLYFLLAGALIALQVYFFWQLCLTAQCTLFLKFWAAHVLTALIFKAEKAKT